MKPKAKLSFVLAVLILALALTPSSAATPGPCDSFCARALCLAGYTCGLFTLPSGQKVCTCHL